MLSAALLLGLISSLHCIGMCGPIAMLLPVPRYNPEKKALMLVTYHFGRIISYCFIGLLFGFIGRGLSVVGLQQNLAIFSGVAMIIMVAVPANIFAKYNFSQPVFRFITSLKGQLGNQLKKGTLQSALVIGALNGLLPCGMVYAALFGALAMPGLHLSVLYMALFGLGTVPLMSGVVYLQHFFVTSVRNKIQKVIPYAVACIGILFIMRGLGLDIPYISPSNMSLTVKAMPNCR